MGQGFTSNDISDFDQALKDYVRVSIGLFAPRFDETFEVNIAE